MAVSDWSPSAADNTSLGGIFIGPNMARADVDNAFRQMMAELSVYLGSIQLETASQFASAIASANVLTPVADISVGSTAPTDPGSDWIGDFPITYNTGDGQGERVFNRADRTAQPHAFGREQLFVWLNLIRTFATCKVALVGDSNTAGYAGTELATILGGIPGVTVTNYGVSGSQLTDWINNTGTVNGTGNHMTAVLAANPDLIVFGYGYTNEPYVGSRTLAQYDADLEVALAAIRSALPRRVCSVLMLSASSQNDGTNGRGEAQVHRARRYQRRAAIKYGCAWFDKLALGPDASVDFGSGTNQNTWLDSNRVHTQNGHSTLIAASIADFLIPKGFGARAVLGEHPVIDSTVISPAQSDALSKYPRGGAITLRAQTGSGWDLDGFVTTVAGREGVGGATQTLWAYGGAIRLERHWNNAVSAWTPFVTPGVAALIGNAVTSDAVTAYPRGLSSKRALSADGWPLDGFVTTFRESTNGGYGWQELMQFATAAPMQRRTYTGAGWSSWSALW